MDFRKHLGAAQELVLPYLGGLRVDAPDRSLRLDAELTPGWWRFSVSGRRATPKDPTDAPDLSQLPRVRGFLLGPRLVGDRGSAERVNLMPEEQPSRFAPASARRWHGGALIFDGLEFESGIEEDVRRALEDGRTLAELKGVPAPLRSAFAYALADQVGRTLQLPAHPLELQPHVGAIADGGVPEAERVLRRLDAERRAYQAMLAARPMPTAGPNVRVPEIFRRPRRFASFDERAEAALQDAGARMRRTRQLSGHQVEVTWDFMGETFISIVHDESLQVVDSGVCLAGADSMVTLESLPSVIREAIEHGRLVITRHWD
ncbi:MAG: hypothetical protein JST54_28650 [Deltaproteobacteria bacterium]|nr:hypothetical protein [Deltaproteobacteria bacterium]